VSRRIAVLDGSAPAEGDASDASIARRLAAGEPFWLDLQGFDDADLALLRDVVHLHPLALEDARTLGRRPKVEEYGEMTYIVAFGAAAKPDRDRLVEVHVVYAERFVISLRRDDSAAIDALAGRPLQRPDHLADAPALLYELLDALSDSFFPAMDEVDDELERIESALAEPPRDGLQDDIYALRRRLLGFRKAVMPQRDLLARIATGSVELPGVDANARRYFRDVEDHLIRIAEVLDGYRDLLQGANDVYLSAVSNRLNVVTKQLTVIAGVFLPLAFITGFFGQNFGWMVDHVGGAAAFFGLGIGLQVATVAVLIVLFRRRGWLSSS
jgi:magnesium transporter